MAGLSSFKQARRQARLEQARATARERGGRLLTKRFSKPDAKLLWQCAQGHRWRALWNSVRTGSWCPTCGRRLPTMDDMRRLAAQRGGRCLSVAYINGRTPLQWQCAKKHVWWARPGNIRHHWCPFCARNRKLELSELRKIARRRRGRLVSRHYVNNQTHLLWRCQEGHVWKARPAQVKDGPYRSGTWCPKCSRKARRGRPRPVLTLEDMQEIGRQRGGECLSDLYINCQTKLKWRCRQGHEWMAKPEEVKRGSWCPPCSRRALEFFQFQATAAERGGRLISSEAEFANSSSLLVWECAEGHRWTASGRKIRDGSWCPSCAAHRPLSLEEMRELARAWGGECLSHRYVNSHTALRWRCARGHVWKATPNRIKPCAYRKRGNWCLVCARAPKRNIEDMRAVARARGGECLSKKYLNATTPLLWRCGQGHVWKASASDVLRASRPGRWCPRCARERGKLTIEQMQAIARAKGGECLSKRYINIKTPLRWRCAKGHTWLQTPNKVKPNSAREPGRWCPICSRKRTPARARG